MSTTVHPSFAARLPGQVLEAASQARLEITSGLPHETWNGLTADTFTVGAKQGAREVHLTPPGLHPATPEQAFNQYAWNEPREKLWNRLANRGSYLRERLGLTHVALGGSYFSTDWYKPSDIDGVAFYDPGAYAEAPHPPYETPLQYHNRLEGDAGVHFYDWAQSFKGFIPLPPLKAFSRASEFPRPREMDLSGPKGPPVGLVLLDLNDFK